MAELSVWHGNLEISSRPKKEEPSDAPAARVHNYRIEQETKTAISAALDQPIVTTGTKRTVVTPEIAWQRAINALRLRGHDFQEAWELAWQDKRFAMAYVYFCMAKERLVKDYPPTLWNLQHLKMLHRKIRNTNKNVEPKRLPGLRWILTTEQSDTQYTGASGLESPLTIEQVYCRMGGFSIPPGAVLEDQIIRRIDLTRALRGLTPVQRAVFLLRSDGWKPDWIRRKLNVTPKSYESLCRSLHADRSAGIRIRQRLVDYDHGQMGELMRGRSEVMDLSPLYAYENERLGNSDRAEPARTDLFLWVRRWRRYPGR